MNTFDFKKYLTEGKLHENNVEDFNTQGYVETMDPKLFAHVEAIVKIFQEWKNGPMTEPGMEEYAKADLVDYITGKIRTS